MSLWEKSHLLWPNLERCHTYFETMNDNMVWRSWLSEMSNKMFTGVLVLSPFAFVIVFFSWTWVVMCPEGDIQINWGRKTIRKCFRLDYWYLNIYILWMNTIFNILIPIILLTFLNTLTSRKVPSSIIVIVIIKLSNVYSLLPWYYYIYHP